MKKDWRGVIENVLEKSHVTYSSVKKQNFYNLFVVVPNNLFITLINLIKYNMFFYKTSLSEVTAYEGELKYNIKNKKKNFLTKTPVIVIYNFYSHIFQKRLFILLYANKFKTTNSIAHLFLNASWLEREAGEMYGIHFRNQWDSRNLLLEYSFNQHPLLKSFPTTGYEEVKYDLTTNWIVRTKITMQF